MLDVVVPRRLRHELEQRADLWTTTFNPALVVPVRVESIIENSMGGEFAPDFDVQEITHSRSWVQLPGAHDDFKFMIHVDNEVYEQNGPELRHELAMQVAHVELHHNMLNAATSGTLGAWSDFVASMAGTVVKAIDAEAFQFASAIEMPAQCVYTEWDRVTAEARPNGARVPFTPREVDILTMVLAKRFGVPVHVARYRLRALQLKTLTRP